MTELRHGGELALAGTGTCQRSSAQCALVRSTVASGLPPLTRPTDGDMVRHAPARMSRACHLEREPLLLRSCVPAIRSWGCCGVFCSRSWASRSATRLSMKRRLDRAPSSRSCSFRCSWVSWWTVDSVLECGVVRDKPLNGFAGDHLVDPGGFDPLVPLLAFPIVAAAAAAVGGCVLHEGSGVGVFVAEGDGHAGSLGDGPDGQPAALAMELAGRRFDLRQFPLRLAAAGSAGGFGGVWPHAT